MEVAAAFIAACRAELAAPKPGNVHRWAAGHGMTALDFERSAEAAAGPLARSGTRLGVRIHDAVAATRSAVGQNTNLGILLLCAPLACAATDLADEPLAAASAAVLAALDCDDAARAFAAIRLAAPGGLGRSARHDVHAEPLCSLLEAMAEAADRDRVAWNYAHELGDIFDQGLPLLQELEGRGWAEPWCLTAVYLDFLARLPDSHVVRKHGAAEAAALLDLAQAPRAGLLASGAPEGHLDELLALDRLLKSRDINPGTSADLTVATAFAARLLRRGPKAIAGNRPDRVSHGVSM
jgi:triphosphoribosyl-dephospho-CoA synthase